MKTVLSSRKKNKTKTRMVRVCYKVTYPKPADKSVANFSKKASFKLKAENYYVINWLTDWNLWDQRCGRFNFGIVEIRKLIGR